MRLRSFLGSLSLALLLPAAEPLPAIVLADFEDGYVPGIGGEGRQPESEVTLVSSPVHGGRQAAKLSYLFRKDVKPRQYVEMWVNRHLEADIKSVSAWIHGDGSKQLLKLRARDKTGEWLQYRYGVIDWQGWRHVTIPLRKPAFEVSWGGDEDGKPTSPVSGIAFLIDSAVEPATGELIFDDITYSAVGEPLDFVRVSAKSEALGNAFYGQLPEFAVQVQNGLDSPQRAFPVVLRVLGADGQEFSRAERTLSLPAKGTADFSLGPVLAQYGLYRAVISYRDREETIPFSYLPPADTRDADLSSPFGVSMHFGHGGRGPIENNLKLASDLGIRWVRDDASWGSVEKEKGVYKVPPTFDRFLRTTRKDWGCEPMIILDYNNALYCKDRAVATEEERVAFANWAEFMAREYRDSVTYWEVWNEANISGFWQPKPNAKDYALLLKATYAAVKRGNPDAQVVAMVTAGIDLNFIDKVLAEGTVGYFDAISVHPYRYPAAPEAGGTTMLGHFQKLLDVLAKHGIKDTPIYNTEVGWPNQDDPRGLPEATSAAYLSRMYVQLHTIPQIRSTFWYDFQNDGQTREYNEHNFGLLRNDFTPKAPAVAYRMTSLALEGRHFVRELDTRDEGTRAFLFAGNDGSTVLAAWSTTGVGSLNTVWRTAGVRLLSACGATQDLGLRRGALVVELSEMPVFVIGAGSVKLAKPTLSGEGTWTVPGRAASLALKLRNPLPVAVGGSLAVTLPEGWSLAGNRSVLLDRRKSGVRTLTVRPPVDAEPGKSHPVTCRWLSEDGTFLGAVTVPVELKPATSLSLTFEPSARSLRVEVSSPLAARPVVTGAHLRFTLPDGTETTRDVLANFRWSGFSLPCPALTVAPTGAELTLTFAEVPPVKAQTEFNLWPVPLAGIMVDGKGEDWQGTTRMKLTTFDGPGKDKWTGPKDASATVSLARDLDALYLYAEVTDDKHAQAAAGAGVWEGDGIQLSLAPMNGKPEDRVEIGFTLTTKGPQVYRWTQDEGVLESVALKVIREGTTTRYEAAIPWPVLGGHPPEGTLRRFALVVNDRDNKEREGWLRLFKGLGWRKDTSQHGLLRF